MISLPRTLAFSTSPSSGEPPSAADRKVWIALGVIAALGAMLVICASLAIAAFAASRALDQDSGSLNTGALYDPASNEWITLSMENAPSGRYDPYVFWTGEEMLVWGGYDERAGLLGARKVTALGDGGLYNPATNSWRSMSTDGAPDGRRDAIVIWTGSELYVWGGIGDGGRDSAGSSDGARYVLATDSWHSMSTEGAPSPRFDGVGVWTGSELIVWSGNTGRVDDAGCSSYAPDGGRYDPESDSWTALPTVGGPRGRRNPAAVWTGKEMVIVGAETGGRDCALLATAGRFIPSANGWFEMEKLRPEFQSIDTARWAGDEVIIWGESMLRFGIIPGSPVQIWDPETDTWEGVPNPGWFGNVPAFDMLEGDGWLIVDGPRRRGRDHERIVALLHLRTRWWTKATEEGMPDGDPDIAGWNGQTALVLRTAHEAGYDVDTDLPTYRYDHTGWRYDAEEDRWSELPSVGKPSPRTGEVVIWTGSEFIVWGGLERD